jgi:FdhD protein
VVEEPLEIRIKKGDQEEQLGITMRTPGSDLQLAAGFLWGEGFLTKPEQLISVKVCGDRSLTPRQRANVVIAEVTNDAPDFSRKMDRRFTMNSEYAVQKISLIYISAEFQKSHQQVRATPNFLSSPNF